MINHLSHLTPAPTVAEPQQNYEILYPLVAGSGLFKGKKPIAVIIDNQKTTVATWKQLVETVLTQCMKYPIYVDSLHNLAGKVTGQKRIILGKTPTSMRSPLKLAPGLYFETHYDTETLLNVLITRILTPIGYDCKHITVVIRNM